MENVSGFFPAPGGSNEIRSWEAVMAVFGFVDYRLLLLVIVGARANGNFCVLLQRCC